MAPPLYEMFCENLVEVRVMVCGFAMKTAPPCSEMLLENSELVSVQSTRVAITESAAPYYVNSILLTVSVFVFSVSVPAL